MKQIYFITGASGFIGANLVRKLVTDGNKHVHILTRPQSDLWRLSDVIQHLHVHSFPFEDEKLLTKTIQKIQPHHVFHLAAYGGNSRETNISEMIAVNIQFPTRLLEVMNDIPYESFILTGSSSEYGYKKHPMKETDVLEPASFYAATKAAMTHMALVFSKKYQKPIAIVRPFSVYGPYEGPSRLIPTVINKCLTNKNVALTSGTEKHDFIYVDDFIECFLKIAERPDISKGKIINIGTGKQTSTKDVVTLIHSLIHSKSKLLWGEYPNHSWDTDFWQADMRLAKNMYNWETTHSVSTGIQKTIAWIKLNSQFYET